MADFTSFINFQDPEEQTYPIPTFPGRQRDLGIPPGASLAPVLDGNDPTIVDKKLGRKSSSAMIRDGGNNGITADDKQKRETHKNIERQRRHEMANLYAALRNLLPFEFIKGKRSTSDQVNEAANYIKYLENNIKEQELKRDKLRHLSDASDVNVKAAHAASSSRNSSIIEFTVQSRSDSGIDVLVSRHDSVEERFPLSSLLKLLGEEGLTIVSCFCTKVNHNFLYTIQSEACHLTGVDLRVLQKILTQKIETWIKLNNWSNT